MTATAYRLTLYENGQIDRMTPFKAVSIPEAMIFADRERWGRGAVLSDGHGFLKQYRDDTFEGGAERLRRRPRAY
jgi:hypothetical protein